MTQRIYYYQGWGNAPQSYAALAGGLLVSAIAVGLALTALRKRRIWKQTRDSSLGPWAMFVVAGGVVAFGIAAIIVRLFHDSERTDVEFGRQERLTFSRE
ncbi:MAG TPA: hypothetical protein VFE47_12060 [Tepidisphaeraceae bacterium]|nr:hypothetical protein [Tepidisphaeraceae bacterium]